MAQSHFIADALPCTATAEIEDHLFKYIEKYSDITVERGLMPEALTIDEANVESDDEYPVAVTLRKLDEPAADAVTATTNGSQQSAIPNGLFRSNLTADTTDALLQSAQTAPGMQTEKVLAKYVVGCDGAHSWTRRQIGSVMEGEHTDYIWGVLDIIPITDFRESAQLFPRQKGSSLTRPQPTSATAAPSTRPRAA